MKIVSGNTKYVHLPENHLIKQYCRKNKIDSFVKQNELMDLINGCIVLAFNEMMGKNSSSSNIDAFVEEMEKRAEEL